VPDVRAVIFDYGGVLTTPVGPSIRAWLSRESIDPASFSRALRAWLSRTAPRGTPIHRLETGDLTVAEFDLLFAAELVATDGGAVPQAGLLAGLFADVQPDPAMVELVGELKDAGLKVALLSNSWGTTTYPREQFDTLFDVVVISGEVRMRKPDPEIFEHTLQLLGVEPPQAIFVDDAEPNIEGAQRLGMQAILHLNHAETRAEIGQLVPGSLMPELT
jgi:putative hydrolase of the HAD superfamily